jgi:hypothetical protein
MAVLDSLRRGPAGRSSILDRLSDGQPVDPAEREAQDQLSIQQMGEFQKGLRRFGYNAAATTRAAIGQFAEPFAPEFADRQFDAAEEITRSQPGYLRPEVESFRDVNSLRSAVAYASGALGEGLPSVASVVAGGLLGRGAASAARMNQIARNAAQYAGGAAAMFPQEAGETALTLRQNPEAMANTTPAERLALTAGRGVVSGALESVVPTALATNAITGAAGRIAGGVAPALKTIARKGAAGVVGEGATEAAQEFTGQAAENIAAPGTGYDTERALEAAVRGAITGGVLGGAGGTIQAVRSNITDATERAQEAVGDVDTSDILNRTVESIDRIIRNPEEFGADLTNTTLGALAEAQTRAVELETQLEERAAPAAARGMDALAEMRRRFDAAVAGKLTLENRKKYIDLTENIRLLQPAEYSVLRDALETNDPAKINFAIGAVSRRLTDRVPKQTMGAIRSFGKWVKNFGRGVTNAARERRASVAGYNREEVLDFVRDFAQQRPDIANTLLFSQEDVPATARTLMALRDGNVSPKELDALQTALEPVGIKLNDFTGDLRSLAKNGYATRRRQPAPATLTPEEEAELATTGNSQMNRIASDAEMFLMDETLLEMAERDGIDPTTLINPRGDGSVRRAGDNELMNEEDRRTTPFSNLGVVRRSMAPDNLPRNPATSIRTYLSSSELTPQQLGRALQGRQTIQNDDDGQYVQSEIELPDADRDRKLVRDKDGNPVAYAQDFNTVNITAQAGKPRERGGSREDFEAFVSDFSGTPRDVNIQGYRLLSAIASLQSSQTGEGGITIPRDELPADIVDELVPDKVRQQGVAAVEKWYENWQKNDPIKIHVTIPPGSLTNDTKIQVGQQERTLGDLNGANRGARTRKAQRDLLEVLLENIDPTQLITFLQDINDGKWRGTTFIKALAVQLEATPTELAQGRLAAKGRTLESLTEEEQLGVLQQFKAISSAQIQERVRRLRLTADALQRGLWGFAKDQVGTAEFNELKKIEKSKKVNELAPKYLEDLNYRLSDAAIRARDADTKRALKDGMKSGMFDATREGNDVAGSIADLKNAKKAARERAALEREIAELDDAEERAQKRADLVEIIADLNSTEEEAQDRADAFLRGLGINPNAYRTTKELTDLLEEFRYEELLRYQLAQENFDGEPIAQGDTPEQELETIQKAEKGETRLRQKGISSQRDRQNLGARLAGDVEYSQAFRRWLQSLPEDAIKPVMPGVRPKAKHEQLRLPFRFMYKGREYPLGIEYEGREYLDLTHIYVSYGMPGVGDELTANFDQAQYDYYLEKYAAKIAADALAMADLPSGAPTPPRRPTPRAQDPVPFEGEVEDLPPGVTAGLTNALEKAVKTGDFDSVREQFLEGITDPEAREGIANTIAFVENTTTMRNAATEEELDAAAERVLKNPLMKIGAAETLNQLREDIRENIKHIGAERFREGLRDGTYTLSNRTLQQRVVNNWTKKYLPDGAQTKVAYIDRDNPDFRYFAETTMFGPGSFVDVDTFHGAARPGSTADLTGDGVSYIFIEPPMKARGAAKSRAGMRRNATLAHEFGHIIQVEMHYADRDAWDKLSDMWLTDIANDPMKATSIARFISNDETDDGMARIMSGELPAETVKQKLQDWLSNATNPYDPQDILGQKIQANLYALGFGEWFAENFARYALNEPSVFAQADQGVRTHLDRIIAALKKFYDEVVKGQFATNESFAEYIESIAARRNEIGAVPDRVATIKARQQEDIAANDRRLREMYDERMRRATGEIQPDESGPNTPPEEQAPQEPAPTPAPTQRLSYQKRISRADLRANPNTLYVFGDNMVERGMGGQAKEMRGEPNAVGIPTKKFPHMRAGAFFTDADFDAWFAKANPKFQRLKNSNQPIVWPEDGIGTGLAQLQQRAPRIWAQLEAWRAELEGGRAPQQAPQAPEPTPAAPPAGDWEAQIRAATTVADIGRVLRSAPADQRAALAKIANERTAELRGVSSAPNNNEPPPPSGNEPPSSPPPPPSGDEPPSSPPPPPPNNEARQRFLATVKKMLRDRVKVEFDAELSDGVAAEWANADGEDLKSNIENLKKVTETRREEIRKLKFKRSATPEQVKRGLVDERSEDTILASIKELEERAESAASRILQYVALFASRQAWKQRPG